MGKCHIVCAIQELPKVGDSKMFQSMLAVGERAAPRAFISSLSQDWSQRTDPRETEKAFGSQFAINGAEFKGLWLSNAKKK